MNTWHSVSFDDREKVAQKQQAMIAIWQSHWKANGRPSDFGIFMAHDLETGAGHFYFTPSATPLALKFGATPCAKPQNIRHLQFLLGDEGAIELLPDFRRNT